MKPPPQQRGQPDGGPSGEPLCAINRWKRPLASGETIKYPASIAPADWPNTVTFAGLPPNFAMLSWTQRSARS